MMLQRFVDPAAVEAEIERVRSLSGNALRRRWQSVFGRSPPEHLTADLLRRMIANRIQEEAFGTLDRATLKLLDGLARRDGSRKAEHNLKIGTVLVRDYQGQRRSPDRMVAVSHTDPPPCLQRSLPSFQVSLPGSPAPGIVNVACVTAGTEYRRPASSTAAGA
jgi:hypothetical protein